MALDLSSNKNDNDYTNNFSNQNLFDKNDKFINFDQQIQ